MEIELKLDDQQQGGFYIEIDGRQMAELEFDIKDNVLNAYHTGVRPELEGQGVAGKLFKAMTDYARENNYKVKPTCPYIAVMFKRQAATIGDLKYEG